jgi:hypothetical protein
MAVRPEAVRGKRRDDQQALDEIRRLFARYREVARHGQAREHDTIPEARTDVRSGPSESRPAESTRS